MKVKSIEKKLKAEFKKRKITKKLKTTERHVYLDNENYTFIAETFAIVTRKFGSLAWTSRTSLEDEDLVVEALLLELK